MRRLLIIVLAMMCTAVLYGEKITTLKEIVKPVYLHVDNECIYVCDCSSASIFVYSLEDFKLETKFGKAGEGPKEFMLNPGGVGFMVFSQKDVLIVNSVGKISIFGKDGTFIKAKRTESGPMYSFFRIIGEKFVGMDMESDKNRNIYMAITLYDSELKKIKRLTRISSADQGKFVFPSPSPMYYVSGNKIVTTGQTGLSFDVFDENGNKIKTISKDYKRLKVTSEYREGVHDFFKTNPSTKFFYESVLKKRLKFTTYYPAVQSYVVTENKIYAQTYLTKGEMHEYFIFGLDGKFLKRLFLPVKYLNAIKPSPKCIKNNKLYQLIENEEKETWELHVTGIM